MMKTHHIADALREIAARNGGRITPEMVVESASDQESPLHDCFTWDDQKAAHEHRLYEARALIRSVKVEVTTTQFTVRAPAFVRDPSAGDAQGYASLARLRSDGDVAREAVVSEFARASAALARAKAVAAALGIDPEEIEDVRGRIVAFSNRLQEQEASVAA